MPDEECARLGALLPGLPSRPLPVPDVRDLELPPVRARVPDSLAALVSSAPHDRASHALGKAYRDVVRALRGDLGRVPDLVARPATERDVVDLLNWAAETGADVAQLRMVYDRVGDARVREQILFAYSRAEDQASTRELLRVARGKGNLELRKRAVFWLGQKTDPEITLELGNLVSTPKLDARVREHAILVLSQRPVEEGVPALIHIARNNPDRRLRERAIALLGSSGDPRAVELYESSLTRE